MIAEVLLLEGHHAVDVDDDVLAARVIQRTCRGTPVHVEDALVLADVGGVEVERLSST